MLASFGKNSYFVENIDWLSHAQNGMLFGETTTTTKIKAVSKAQCQKKKKKNPVVRSTSNQCFGALTVVLS